MNIFSQNLYIFYIFLTETRSQTLADKIQTRRTSFAEPNVCAQPKKVVARRKTISEKAPIQHASIGNKSSDKCFSFC